MSTISPAYSFQNHYALKVDERMLLGQTNQHLKRVDPACMNLYIATGIPALASLDVSRYTGQLDEWAASVRSGLVDAEREFHRTPQHWKRDINFFRLGYLCYYVDECLLIRYRDDQRDLKRVSYTDPSDLFLNGVIDTRRGTCANMAMLHVALGWRLGWPVSLACVGSHLICRYDDGKVTHNVEATKTGGHGFHSHPDKYYIREHHLPRVAVECGSDLRALTPQEMLGIFFGLRARHFVDINRDDLAESDYLTARSLFPNNRHLHFCQMMASVQYGMRLFATDEPGHPIEFANWMRDLVATKPWERIVKITKEPTHADSNSGYRYDESGRQK